jgi:hypothetical protein
MALTQVQGGMILASGQSIPKAALPTGSVLQVVNAAYATDTSTTSASFSPTGLTASITPTSASSKILVVTGGCDTSTTSAAAGVKLALYRNTTLLKQYTNNIPYIGTGGNFYITGAPSITYLDSPSTTSSVSYSVYFAAQTGGNTVTIQRDGTTATITLMEIAA